APAPSCGGTHTETTARAPTHPLRAERRDTRPALCDLASRGPRSTPSPVPCPPHLAGRWPAPPETCPPHLVGRWRAAPEGQLEPCPPHLVGRWRAAPEGRTGPSARLAPPRFRPPTAPASPRPGTAAQRAASPPRPGSAAPRSPPTPAAPSPGRASTVRPRDGPGSLPSTPGPPAVAPHPRSTRGSAR